MYFGLLLLLLVPPSAGHLSSRLRDYELIYPEGLERRLEKREAAEDHPARYNRIHSLRLRTKHRSLRLYLTPAADLFSPDFAASIRSGAGEERRLSVDPDSFLTGHVFGEANSSVSVHLDGDGALTATVSTPAETFHFEPAWRHLPTAPPNATLAYRASDVREGLDAGLRSRCAYVDPTEEGRLMQADPASPAESLLHRWKRALTVEEGRRSKRRRCSLKLVADYRFYEKIGGKDEVKTIAYLVNLISRVNDIYQHTLWRDSPAAPGFDDRGFLIKAILVHDSPSPADPSLSRPHYNSEVDMWDVESLLASFTESEGSRPLELCLAHLFTYQSFKNGVLGLGYIASPRVGTSGGICSAPSSSRGPDGRPRQLYYNSALSSAKSTYGAAVITREADIVTAHELGHNWGAPHDPNTPECSPTQAHGGPYIMHTYSVSGHDPNNKAFSPCSLRSIKKVLLSKAPICFEEPRLAYCGNRRVEEGEECDAGLHGDACCLPNCRLRANATCSPVNADCCSLATCAPRSAGSLCRPSPRLSCTRPAYCDGRRPHCPPPQPVEDGRECLDEGECQAGQCVDFCQRRDVGMRPCICENVTESCFRCCKAANGLAACRPFASRQHPLRLHRDGRPCIHGFCDADGACIRQEQDVVEHLWNVVSNLRGSKFLKFMEDNLVGFVILFSLLVWIPASYLVHRRDKEMEAWSKGQAYDPSVDGALSGKNRIEVARGVLNSSFNPSPSVPKPAHL